MYTPFRSLKCFVNIQKDHKRKVLNYVVKTFNASIVTTADGVSSPAE